MADQPDSDKMELKQDTPPATYEGAAPPSYETASKGAPPSYNELFGISTLKSEVMEAKQGSSNKGIFAMKFCEIMCGSVLCMIGLIILAALPVAMIIIGSIYLRDCEGQDKIPIWLIVFGCFSLVQTTINLFKRCCKFVNKKERDEEEGDVAHRANRGGSCLESVISVFLFIWTIIGSVWVFGFYDNYQNCQGMPSPNPADCCHPVPFLFSFITLLVMYAFSLLFLCCCCCCFICVAFVAGVTAE